MSYTSDPADQIVRYSLEGTEIALKLSGLAAKNFALFAYAVLKDNKKTHGKTRLARLLKEQKPLKFFTVPEERMREFAKEAKRHGLLFVPVRDRAHPGAVEITVLAQDAAKVNRIMDRMRLDFVKASAGEAVPELVQENTAPAHNEATAHTKTANDEMDFPTGGFEDNFMRSAEDSGNFMPGWADKQPERTAAMPEEWNPSGPSLPSRNFSRTPSEEDRPSVLEELRSIRKALAEKMASRTGPEKTKAVKRKPPRSR